MVSPNNGKEDEHQSSFIDLAKKNCEINKNPYFRFIVILLLGQGQREFIVDILSPDKLYDTKANIKRKESTILPHNLSFLNQKQHSCAQFLQQ